MKQEDLAGLTVYSDLMIVLKERGYTDAEASEIFLELTSQAEMEVTEELLSKMSDEQLALLESLPDSTPAEELAAKLGLNGEDVDAIRAEKTARLISEMIPAVDEGDDQVAS